MFLDDRDQLDPRASLPPSARAKLRALAAETVRRVWADLAQTLAMDEDGRWRDDTDRDGGGWTAGERLRFAIWLDKGQEAPLARRAWREQTGRDFLLYLVAYGRIGRGDEVTAR